jgi:glutamate---cysteine ligase / carboxylate-amine ligase
VSGGPTIQTDGPADAPKEPVEGGCRPALAQARESDALTAPHFGVGPNFCLGVEEEHVIVSSDGSRLVDCIDSVSGRGRTVRGRIESDTFAACIELVTPIVPNATQAGAALTDLRHAAADAGVTLMGAAAHPTAPWGDAAHASQPRYRQLAADLGWLLERTPTCALHVHVGMPDPECAIKVYNRLREMTPVLIALAANSPFHEGRDSRHASVRWGIWRAFPRTGTPPRFRGYEHYANHVAEHMAAGEVEDFSYLWWDVRPNPRLGTVEMRVMDAQSDLQRTVGLAALVHGLSLSFTDTRARPALEDSSAVIEENCFRAARDGLDALLWDGERHRSARELATDAFARARQALMGSGDESALEPVHRILREGNGADRQRAAYARGGQRCLLSDLLAETLGAACASVPGRHLGH